MNALTISQLARQDILNNQYAVYEIENQLKIETLNYHKEVIFTKKSLAEYFEVDIRTIERYMESNKEELSKNGYKILKGPELKAFKEYVNSTYGPDKNIGTKVSVLGIFTFRAFLNMAMIISESDRAKEIRNMLLDIVVDVMKKKADEYKQILKLKENDKIRDTLYSEVLDLISLYEGGLAYEIKLKYKSKGKKLNQKEVKEIITSIIYKDDYLQQLKLKIIEAIV